MGDLIVALVGTIFLVFVVLTALRGRRAKRQTTQQLRSDMEYIYRRTQRRHQKKKGRPSSELTEARSSHLKVVQGRASASEP